MLPFDLRRLPYYLSVAAVAAMLCSIRASSLTIAAAVLAVAAFHFRNGDALRFPPVKLPLAPT